METNYHKSVLLHSSVQQLVHNPDGIYVDCTFGGGGHSKEILNQLSLKGKLYAFDQDEDAIENTIDDERFTLIPQNFRYLKNYLRFYGVHSVDGVLADLGVSSHQFDVAKRGFSIRFEGELDMRMNHKQDFSAKQLINEYSEEQLASIFYLYGELSSSKRMAKEIVIERTKNPINTTKQLTDLFDYLPKNKKNKILAQLFQAIRIEVNDELKALKEMLEQSREVLNKEGRLVVISYHSLEDRLVKKFLKTGLFEGEPERDLYGNWKQDFKVFPNKATIPTDEEIADNPRARSAKLRVGIKN